jgi:STE24 endopeptidase
MNPFALIVLVALVLEYVLQVVADVLNMRALEPELPPEFDGAYDQETYRRSQEYTRAKTRFGFVPGTLHLALVLAFWGLGGFEWLDELVRGFGFGPILTGLCYIGAIIAGLSVIGLPMRLWSTFVIEERFGFNKTDGKTFAGDYVKSLCLGILLGGPLLAAILYFFDSAGSMAWLYCWGALTVFTLLVQFLAPTLILPLFNKFEPIEEGDLKDTILAFGKQANFPLDGIFVIDGSKRSTKANAFFTGFGKNKRIALFDTLIAQQSADELVAVLAHEIGHYKRGHILKSTVLSILNSGVLFFLLSIALERAELFEAFGVTNTSVYAGLVFFMLLYTPVEMVLSTALSAFSRKNEFEADAFASETTGKPENLVSALVKLSAESLSNLTPHPFHVFLHASHPPVMRRIAALRAGS